MNCCICPANACYFCSCSGLFLCTSHLAVHLKEPGEHLFKFLSPELNNTKAKALRNLELCKEDNHKEPAFNPTEYLTFSNNPSKTNELKTKTLFQIDAIEKERKGLKSIIDTINLILPSHYKSALNRLEILENKYVSLLNSIEQNRLPISEIEEAEALINTGVALNFNEYAYESIAEEFINELMFAIESKILTKREVKRKEELKAEIFRKNEQIMEMNEQIEKMKAYCLEYEEVKGVLNNTGDKSVIEIAKMRVENGKLREEIDRMNWMEAINRGSRLKTELDMSKSG